jgi:hypothetical protein
LYFFPVQADRDVISIYNDIRVQKYLSPGHEVPPGKWRGAL